MPSGVYVRTEEHCEIIRKSRLGKHHSEETKRKIGLANAIALKGYKHSEKTKNKMSKNSAKFWLGKELSEEHKINLSKNSSHYWLDKGGVKHPGWKGGVTLDRKNYNRKIAAERYLIFKRGGKLSIQTIQQVYEENIKQYGTLTCYLCLKPIIFKDDSLEHKVPLIRDGTNAKENLAIAHRRCNSKKEAKTTEEYLEVIKNG